MNESNSEKSSSGRSKAEGGFTLIELVVAIAIIGLLLGALLAPLTTQIKIRKNRDAERALSEIQEALMGFAVAERRLPCPDTDADGVADPVTGGPCAALEGFLPSITLGVDSTDTWGRRYRYRVTAEFSYAAVTGMPSPAANQLDLDDAGNITVIDRADDKSPITLTSNAVAVVVSLGANGHGGRDLDGNTLVVPVGADEQANLNAGATSPPTFYRRGHSPGADTCDDAAGPDPFCEYDDLVKWLPEALLKSRMVAAERLP